MTVGDAFGIERLQDWLTEWREGSAREALEDLVMRLRHHGGNAPFEDDVTLVFIRRPRSRETESGISNFPFDFITFSLRFSALELSKRTWRRIMKVRTFVAGSFLMILMPMLAWAQSNVVASSPVPWGQNVFSGPTPSGVGRILYAPSDPDDPAYRAAIAGLSGAIVDYFDTRAATPTADLLATYDCVYAFPNYILSDATLFGNRLADYVDGGGKVILGVFCTVGSGFWMSGRIMTSAYCPVVSPQGTNHYAYSSYANDGKTCLYSSVASFDCGYRDFLVTQGSGVVDGHYVDGEIALAYRPDKRVIYCNGGGGNTLGGHGDWPRIIANACSCDNAVAAENDTWGKLKAKYR